jgi:hypothetical protein
MTGFIVLGLIAAIAGATSVLTGIRGGPDVHPRNMAMLIGGMMLTAFGIVIAGFAIVYNHTAPLDMGTAQ